MKTLKIIGVNFFEAFHFFELSLDKRTTFSLIPLLIKVNGDFS
ncbi:conserved hypothetical protein [delta proteobacterium NaphS2]|nr:conserved hypothetical protein [delta proteobacterium NaphS2]